MTAYRAPKVKYSAVTCLHPSGRRKNTYRSVAKARQAAKKAQHRELRPYACPACGSFHLTSQAPR